MSVFKEMSPDVQFDSWYEYNDLRRMLSEAMSRGYVEEMPVLGKHSMIGEEYWYRDKDTGEIYSLVPPDFPDRGSWQKVDLDDLKIGGGRPQ